MTLHDFILRKLELESGLQSDAMLNTRIVYVPDSELESGYAKSGVSDTMGR